MTFLSIFGILPPNEPSRIDEAQKALNEGQAHFEAAFNRFVGTCLALQTQACALEMPFSRIAAKKGVMCTPEKLFLRMTVEQEPKCVPVEANGREIFVKTMPVTSSEDLAGKRVLAVESIDEGGVRFTFKFVGRGLFYREDEESGAYSNLSILRLEKDGTVTADGPCWSGFALECFIDDKRVASLPLGSDDWPDLPLETARRVITHLNLCTETLSEWASERENLIRKPRYISSVRHGPHYLQGIVFSPRLRAMLAKEQKEIVDADGKDRESA